MRSPRRAPAASPEAIAAGVEITSAQGQAITSSTSALYSACVEVQPNSQGVSSATASASTNTPGV